MLRKNDDYMITLKEMYEIRQTQKAGKSLPANWLRDIDRYIEHKKKSVDSLGGRQRRLDLKAAELLRDLLVGNCDKEGQAN